MLILNSCSKIESQVLCQRMENASGDECPATLPSIRGATLGLRAW